LKKGDIRDKIKFEALIGLVLLVVFVGIGAAMFAGIGTTETVSQAVSPAPATPSNSTPAPGQTAETVQAGTGSSFETYYGEEPVYYDDSASDSTQTDVTDDTTTTDDDSNSDDAQTGNDTTSDDVVEPGDIDNVDDSDISDDEPVPDALPDGDSVLGPLQDVEFLDLVNTETGETFTLDDIADSDLKDVNMDPDGNYTLANYLFDWILAQRESASYFDMENMEVVDPSTEDNSSEVDFGDEDLSFAAGNSSTDDNQDNNDNQDDDTNTDSNQDTSDNVQPGDVDNVDQNSDNTDEPAPDDALTGDALDNWING